MAVSKADVERLRRAAAAVSRRQDLAERKLRRELLPGWRRARAKLGEEAAALAKKIDEQRAAGQEVTESWLHKQERFQDLLDQMEVRIAELTEAANLPVTTMQAEVLRAAGEQARNMTAAALAPAGKQGTAIMRDWNQLKVADVEAMIGRTSAGHPLSGLLKEIAPGARQQAAQVLVQGLVVGRNPRVVARELQNVSDAASSRLLTIARTEALNAQREATSQAYQLNSGILQGWVWQAELDESTCEACIALSGETFTVEETCDAHPNCRCVMVPETMSWDELGLGDLGLGDSGVADQLESGPEWFDRQPEKVQESLLGPGKYEALKAGEIDWPDLVTHVENPEWGGMNRASSLREAKAKAGRRR